MKNKVELLAPGGDINSIKAAIIAGADAVYCGLDSFNARNRAVNLSFEQLNGLLTMAHQHGCQIFLTLNIIILEHEFNSLYRLLNQLVNTDIDGVIVQDLGLFYLLKKQFPMLEVHASTQVTTHNKGQMQFLNKLAVSRVNLSRELNIDEIKALTTVAHQNQMLTEVFVHGSYCIGFSGLCYISSVNSGNSGNRGRCSQPCRDQYQITEAGNEFPLNMKDNSAFFDLPALVGAGVDSLKIEGRIKGASYVYTVVDSWRKQINSFIHKGELQTDNSALYKVFNRDFSNGFLKGDINKLMFIDNPRDNSLKHFIDQSDKAEQSVTDQLYAEKASIKQNVERQIENLNIDKPDLKLSFSGGTSLPLTVWVETKTSSFTFFSASLLTPSTESTINQSALEKRFKSLNNDKYHLLDLQLEDLKKDLFIPFKELTEIKNKIIYSLNGSVDPVKAVTLPILKQLKKEPLKPSLLVLISKIEDIALVKNSDAIFYYKLPDSFTKRSYQKLVDLFLQNPKLTPWFPAVLIAKDYQFAVDFLQNVKPKQIVTNNSGIAYQADLLNIDWVAGPLFNLCNSFSLLCLKENFNCKGAFISSELNYKQIKNIIATDDFKLYSTIYQPIMLMTSRQCFFQQTVGCKKSAIDDRCMAKCEKSTSIINLKGTSFSINKQKGGYPTIYSQDPLLNCEIVAQLAGKFNGFMVDLSTVAENNSELAYKVELLSLFTDLVNKKAQAEAKLKEVITNSSNQQYQKGL